MSILELIAAKILTCKQLAQKMLLWQFENKKIVFTNGCFDILHRGHIEYLAQAAMLGDVLVVGLNSDASVRRLKGANRPLQDETARALVLASMAFVSYVVVFQEDTPYELIKTLQPDVLVKGADYAPEQIAGYDIVKDKGGKIVTIPLVQGYSTTNVAQKMKQNS